MVGWPSRAVVLVLAQGVLGACASSCGGSRSASSTTPRVEVDVPPRPCCRRMSATAPIDGVTLDDYIRARARLLSAPGDLDAVVAQLSLPDADAWRRIEHAWRLRTEQNARLASVVGEFLADYVEELRKELQRADVGPDPAEEDLVRHEVPSYLKESASPAAGPLVPVPPAPAAQAVDLDLTQPPLRRTAGATLPFLRGVDVPAVRAAWADVKQGHAEGPGGGTSVGGRGG